MQHRRRHRARGSHGIRRDGDAVLHAITDAILGASGHGSIGEHFPPTDPQWKGADSATFLTRAQDLARDRAFVIGNIDVIVVAEAPKIAPHARKIRERIADILGIDVDSVSVRGTSTNGLGQESGGVWGRLLGAGEMVFAIGET